MNNLDSLKKHTIVVADTGDVEEMKVFEPRDATTNPSLVLKVAGDPAYADLLERANHAAEEFKGTEAERSEIFVDELFVSLGARILELVPGRVSTEIDARLSFDTEGSIDRALRVIARYERAGISRERILIKLASTWEGIRAAERLEREGVSCNMTLLFGMAQAIACAEANVTLISPFVGRIYDWHKKDRGVDDIPLDQDPGVESVTDIYNYYKRFGHETEVMGASFRKAGQVVALCGCDLLTISPDLLAELAATDGAIPVRLSSKQAAKADLEQISLDEEGFRWMMNEDAMATEKLAEGIRRFHADGDKLRALAQRHVAGAS